MYATHLSLTKVGADGGPLYRETDFARPVAEPFNGATAALFVLVAAYWLVRLKRTGRKFPFLAGCLILLGVGGVGGALFHALRVSRIFYLMDVLPIALLSVAVSLYFWLRVLSSRRWVLATAVPFFLVQRLVFEWFPRQVAISLGYAAAAILILTPILIFLRRTRFAYGPDVLAAVLCFVIALAFRILDPYPSPLFPMGTHWLWHIFSAASVFFLTRYLFRIFAKGLLSPDKIPLVEG